MARKHKAFGIVQQEIGKKIERHKSARRKAPTKAGKKKFDLAIERLKVMERVLATAWNAKTCPPRK